MKKYLFTFAILASIVVAGCKKETLTGDGIPATIQHFNGTKVYVDNNRYSVWHNNDPIKINGFTETVTGEGDTWVASLNNSQTGTLYAIFPADATSETAFSAEGTAVTLPSEQTYTEIAGNQKINAIMAAKGTTSLAFYNLCALIKVHIPSEGTYIKNIKISTVEGDAILAGAGSINFEGQTPVLTMGTTGNTSVTLTVESNRRSDGDYYVVIPAVTNKRIKVTVNYRTTGTDDVQHFLSKSIWQGTASSLEANYIGPVDMGSFVRQRDYLPGIFTIDQNGFQVMFSSGNLIWSGGNRNPVDPNNANYWEFPEHQWDYENYQDFGSIATSENNIVEGNTGYFSWYNSENTTTTLIVHNNASFSGTPYDWGDLFNNTNDKHWFTMTTAQWDYLLNRRLTRTVGEETTGTLLARRYAYGTVNGVNGLILFPDNFPAEGWIANGGQAPTTFNDAATYSNATYSSSQWSYLEEAGCAFIPAAGRVGFQGNTPHRSNDGTDGYYWTPTHSDGNHGHNIHCFHFAGGSRPGTPVHQGGEGLAVRLVYAIEAIAK